mmetsp:Transcript_46992/g.93631  ORF Transcript_46992/g.93631 Transcript_46992/m.93631 type:complete len:125 (+) Transcript_46992:117-491(+)
MPCRGFVRSAPTSSLHSADIFRLRPGDQVAAMASRGHHTVQLGRHGTIVTLELLFCKRVFVDLCTSTPPCFIAAECAAHDYGPRHACGPQASRVRIVHGTWANVRGQRRASMAITSITVLLRMH